MTESAEFAPPPDNAPPAAKGGSLRRFAVKWLAVYPLLFVVLAGGILYAAYQQPRLRPYLQPYWHDIAARAPRRAISAPDEETSAPPAEPVKAAATPRVSADESYAPAAAPAATEIEAAERNALAARIARLEDDVAILRNAMRAASLSPRPVSDAGTRLELIDLRLRLRGDAAAAAEALSFLRGAPDVDDGWLAAEISRLRNAADREQIARALRRLMRAAARDSSSADGANIAADADSSAANSPVASGGNSALAALKQIFNIQRIDRRAASGGGENSDADAGERLRRMEMLLLTGRRDAYLAELREFSADSPPAAAAEIAALRQFGAPVYALENWSPR